MTMVAPISERGKIITNKVIEQLKQDLVHEGLVTKEQLGVVNRMVQHENETLSTVLVRSGFITAEQLANFVGEKMHIPYVDLINYTVDSRVLEIIPEKVARHYKIIPLFEVEGVLTVAMLNPLDLVAVDDIHALAELKIEAVIASEENINLAIDQWYGVGNERRKLVEDLSEELKEIKIERDEESQYSKEITEIRLKKEAIEPPVVKLVNSYIVQAMLEGASDIHLEPKKDFMAIRFRIDGFLYNRHQLPIMLVPSVTSRIKVMSGLDISKRRIPQDGRIGIIIRDRSIDIRTSTFPSMYGENIVLRILDKTRGVPTLSELGFSDEDLNTFKKFIKSTKGIILATGPTGSGKTTTICSAIHAMNATNKNIMTIEDPIEYEIEGIVQSQVNPIVGVTFANALRSTLRQDPDIIYVGEIRDLETAEIAVRAALTGHLVLSTLHTSDAVGAIMRLSDIGVEAGLIESVMVCSFAQRLVRRICEKCRKEYQPNESTLKNLGLPLDTKFYKGEGCKICNDIGYKGRIGIFELFIVNREIRRLIANKVSEQELLETARKHGMKTLSEDGLQKVVKGLTTLDEVIRVENAA